MAAASERSRFWISRSDTFAVAAEFNPPRMTLMPKGELDLATVPALERAVETLPWSELTELVFDLAELTFIDSTGLSVLIQASQRATTEGVWFAVIGVREQPRLVFRLTGVTHRLNIRPSSEPT